MRSFVSGVPFVILALLMGGIVLGVARFASRDRKHFSRHVIVCVMLALVSLPMGAILTLALLPFWRWLEASYAIESVGHSGPAEWCYLTGTLVCLLMLCSAYGASLVGQR